MFSIVIYNDMLRIKLCLRIRQIELCMFSLNTFNTASVLIITIRAHIFFETLKEYRVFIFLLQSIELGAA